MGFAKYYEDNNEIMLGRMERTQYRQVSSAPVHHYICPYCNLIEYSRDKLFEHIKKEHNITHPVIVVNGKVINREDCSIASIENLSIFTYGFADELLLDGKRYYCSESDSIDLTYEAKHLFELNGSFQISVGEKNLLVKKYSIREVRTELINPIIRDWERSVSEGIMISLNLPNELNEIEREYLKGFYNYFIACISEGVNKKDRYYEAYTILKEFNPISSLGICVLKVIAFKFNWLDSLRYLCSLTSDEFNAVCDFYDGVEDPLNAIIIDYQNSLYIEDDIRECVDAINNYMFGNLNEVECYISKQHLEEITDKNQKDRVLVLLSRLAQENNNIRKARHYNGQILSPELQKNI